ncbi:MAG: carboxypeptidase regulatory-like domain-containing protein [Hymenobacteraceae bacterium]|nr:carboxypeptidase regulatory-like domain-containing protein [Hymenobacteraceae bacterium]
MANRVLLCLVFFLCCFGVGTTYAQTGKLSGKVTEKANKSPIPGVNVVVKLNGAVKGFSTTDEKGFYSVAPLVPGNYTVEFINMAFATVKIANVPVEVDKTRFLNADLAPADGVDLESVQVQGFKIPVIDPDNTTTGGTLTNEAIMKIPTREVGTLVATQPGVFASDDRAAVNVKGTRSSGVVYFVNGVKQLGGAPNLPTSAIAQLTVVTGGVPAQYGDAVGGIINITTTSPSSSFSGGIEAESSAPLDQYDNNLLNFNLAGPILKRKAAEGQQAGSLLGFFLSGQYQNSKDDTPLYNGLYQVKADKMAEIKANPFTNVLAGSQLQALPSVRLLRLSDLEKTKVRPNAASQRFSFNSTMDFQPIDNILFSIGGSYDRYRQNLYSENGGLLNSENNQRRFTTNWNTFARFTQNFPSNGDNNALIKNAYYQVQGDFTRFDRVIQHEDYKNNFAKYGYIGSLSQSYLTPRGAFTAVDGTLGFDPTATTVLNGVQVPVYTQTQIPNGLTFTPSGYNQTTAGYTSQLLNDNSLNLPLPNLNSDLLVANGGFRNGSGAQTVQNVYGGQGGPANVYLLQINDQYRLSALGAADIGKHTVKLGFEFEQRIESFYQASPNQIWSAARGLINRHIDTPKPDSIPLSGYYLPQTINGNSAALFVQTGRNTGQESDFSKLIRKRLGFDGNRTTEIVNIDGVLNPDNFSLSDFTAEEAVIQSRLVSFYQGYSYLGKRTTNKRVAFSDFFTDLQNRPQDAYRPTYAAAFLEDKFVIEDLIIRAGVRVDRFDANQRVLKDKYALVDLTRAGDIDFSRFTTADGPAQRPSTIGPDFNVYVSDVNSTIITGYRNGDVLYTADGLVTQDLNQIKAAGSSGKVVPLFNQQAQGSTTPGPGLEYVANEPGRELSLRAFRDYKPQINVMPRVSFSFPISEDALFFAHYDILTQRPENNPVLPQDYYLLAGSVFGSGDNTINNPDLKPQRKIDMQLGFQQRLTQASGLTLSAFYSEMRDLIQYRPVFGAYPNDYITFANLDFGTVKGLTLEYDLRRTKNIAFNASYTLQFAKGTGSNSTSGFNLASQGQPNLRVPIPLDYDQRNQFKGSLDFRFADGEGPVAFGQKFLQNAGVNILMQGGSGTPYTRQSAPTQSVSIGVQQRSTVAGGLNGSRLPGNARVSLRVDKDFALKMGDKRLPVVKTLNLYFRVQNLFNSANVLNVFRYTGSAEDDGYLTSNLNPVQQGLVTPLTLSQNDLYQAKLFGTNNSSIPRRMFIGAVLTF